MKKFLVLLFVFQSMGLFAQDETSEESKIKVEISETGEEVVLGKGSELKVIARDENGKASAILVNKNSEPMVVGLGKDKKQSMLNAYLGYQLFIGANAGVELFGRLQIGAHIYKTRDYDFESVKISGIHANLIIKKLKPNNGISTPDFDLPLKDIYIGSRYNNYSSDKHIYGNSVYEGKLKGKTLDLVVGANFITSNRGTLSFDIGIRHSINSGLKYTGEDASQDPRAEELSGRGDEVYEPGKSYKMISPTFNVQFKVFLNKRK